VNCAEYESAELEEDGQKLGQTSIAKRTPPMGEPNATATPAALAAVRISLILADAKIKSQIQLSRWC